jgi:hypothetical protein
MHRNMEDVSTPALSFLLFAIIGALAGGVYLISQVIAMIGAMAS